MPMGRALVLSGFIQDPTYKDEPESHEWCDWVTTRRQACQASRGTARQLLEQNGLVWERAQAAALQLKLELVPGLCLLLGLGLMLSFPFHPRGVFAAGLPFGLLCRDALRCLVRS